MLKKFILLLCLVAPMALVAQDKIAHINFQEVMSKMPELKDVEAKLATKSETLQKGIQALQTEYQTKLEEYGKKVEAIQKDTTAVSESEIMDAQKELQQLQERIQTRSESAQAEYEKYYQELLTPIHERIRKAIKDVGDEQNYKYIIEASALLYTGSSATDASKQVKTKLGIVD